MTAEQLIAALDGDPKITASQLREALTSILTETQTHISAKKFDIYPGEEDQTDKIASALDSGEHIYFPPGEYHADIIRYPTTAEITGAGKGKVCFVQNPGTSNGGSPVTFIGPENNSTGLVRLSHFSIKGNKAQQTTPNIGLHIDNTGDYASHTTSNPYGFHDPMQVVEDILIMDTKGDGFKQSGRGGGFFDKISTMNCDGHGIHIAGFDNIYGLLDSGGSGLAGLYMGSSAASNRISAVKTWYSGQVDRDIYGQGIFLDGAFLNQFGIVEVQNSGSTGMKLANGSRNIFGQVNIEFPPNPAKDADGIHFVESTDIGISMATISDRGSMPYSLRYGLVFERVTNGCARIVVNAFIPGTKSGIWNRINGQGTATLEVVVNGEFHFNSRVDQGWIPTYANDAAAAAAGLPTVKTYFNTTLGAYTRRVT